MNRLFFCFSFADVQRTVVCVADGKIFAPLTRKFPSAMQAKEWCEAEDIFFNLTSSEK